MKERIIENNLIKIAVSDTGAELISLINKKTGEELLWQGAEGVWSRHSPLLFPNVGRHYNDQYTQNGKTYPSSQHGFARENVFECEETNENALSFVLYDSKETLKIYPSHFKLTASFELKDNSVIVKWDVENTGEETLYFTIGAHPAFNTAPEKSAYNLYFPNKEKLVYKLLDPENKSGTASSENYDLNLENNRLHLTNALFEKDALVFDDSQISEVTLEKLDGTKILTLHSPGFPNYGIWSIPTAPYVCLEPWMGRADDVGFDDEISKKPGIIALEANETFHKEYSIEVH